MSINKKGSALAIVGIILFVIVILGVIITAMILFDKNIKKDISINTTLNTTSLFLMPKDIDLKIPIQGKYLIYYNNSNQLQVYNQGELTPSYNEIVVPKDINLTILCWDKDYYLTKIDTNEYRSESLDKYTLSCNMQRKGYVNISHKGEIKNTFDLITLNISVKDYYKKLAICTAWSPGIIDVSMQDNFVSCDSFWMNASMPNTYYCGEITEVCEYIEGNRCKKLNREDVIPKYKNQVDNCFYTGMNIKDEDRIFNFEIRSFDYKNELDEVTFFVIGMDRVFDENDNSLKWIYDDKDTQYTIKYGEIV